MRDLMDRHWTNICIYEPSTIVYEGISTILLQSSRRFYLYRINDLEELEQIIQKENIDFVLLNPSLLQNRMNDFSKLKRHHPDIIWIGMIYSFFENEILTKLNDTISITDNAETILQKLSRKDAQLHTSDPHEQLTDREIDILRELVKGFTNKEIADKLNISIHTVITHRKNIMDKTGIKSLSGLAIYAITMNIISLDSISL